MAQMQGRRVLVTGGGSGVGAELARSFAAQGAHVAICGRRRDALAAVASESSTITPYAADITDEVSVTALFDALVAADHVPDVVIANAGAADSAPISKTGLELWQRTIDVNLTGVFLTFREALSKLPRDRAARLIAIASTAGLKGYPYVASYCAAKHGVIGLVRALALELAARPVTVNAICPGFTETPMLVRSIENIIDKTGMDETAARAELSSHNPQGRFIQTDEIAATALWLCSDAARSVTGQAISISGGET